MNNDNNDRDRAKRPSIRNPLAAAAHFRGSAGAIGKRGRRRQKAERQAARRLARRELEESG